MDHGYHMPHNAAHPGELRLLLGVLARLGPLSFADLTSAAFMDQVMGGSFGSYHEKPHRCFHDDSSPPDLLAIASALGSEPLARTFVRTRAGRFQALLDGRLGVHEFMESAYKPRSSWRRVWVEYPRDYIDFAVMLGMAYRGDGSACHILDRGRRYLADDAVLDGALMGFTVTVQSGSRRHSIRPYWLTLTILSKAQDAGVVFRAARTRISRETPARKHSASRCPFASFSRVVACAGRAGWGD